MSPLLKPVFLPLIEQISLGRSKIYNLRAPIPILLHLCALLAEVSIRDPWSTAYRAFPLVASEIAFITDLYNCAWSHVGITDDTFSIAFFAEAANGDA